MRLRYFLILILLTTWVLTKGQSIQNNQGINFIFNQTWQEIKQQAIKQDKYIFVDCYASWCGPCKMMDKEVYVNDSVGRFINERFISIKLQCDTSKNDDKQTIKRYKDAHDISVKYKISAFPTFLFFSPQGKLVNRDIGFMEAGDFIKLAKHSTDPKSQYYLLIERYRIGQLPFEDMPDLSLAAEKIGDTISTRIKNDYIHNYLEKQPDEILLTEINLIFISRNVNLINSNDRIFRMAINKPYLIDTVLGHGHARGWIAIPVITREEIKFRIDRDIKHDRVPEWGKINANIINKYGEWAVGDNILKAKTDYYRKTKQWHEYAKYLVERCDKYFKTMPLNAGLNLIYLNNGAFEVFKYSNDKSELEKALVWVNRAIEYQKESASDAIDTKANILYKLNRKQEAILWEEKAMMIEREKGEKMDETNYKLYQDTLDKMKNDLPTWSNNI